MKSNVISINVESPVVDSEFDAFDVAKVYSDSLNPEVAYINMNNPTSGRIDNIPNIFKKYTGETIVQGGNPIHLNGIGGKPALWSSDNKPWGNVEHTFYTKFLAGATANGSHFDANRLFQPYIGGGHHHTDGAFSGEGNAMKLCFFGGGDMCHRKEIFHPGYCGDRGHYNNWQDKDHGTAEWHGPVENFVAGFRRWYGFKQVQILKSDRNRQEVYIDEGADDNGRLNIAGNENRWRLLAVYEDVMTGGSSIAPTGDWTTTTSFPNFNSTNIVNKLIVQGLVRRFPWGVTHGTDGPNHDFAVNNAAACVLRCDGETEFLLAYWSAREINPASKLL